MDSKTKDPFELLGENVYHAKKSDNGKVTFCHGLCIEVTSSQRLNTGSDQHGQLLPPQYRITIQDHGTFDLVNIFESKEGIIELL